VPANLDLLRTPRGLKWSLPAALVLVPGYLFIASFISEVLASGGPDRLNVLVLICIWDAMKSPGLPSLVPSN
jgi:hypothetical protein